MEEQGSNGRAIGSGSFSAERSRLSGGTDVKGGFGVRDRRAQRACEGVKRIARELGVDRKTVRRWLRVGGWQPRRPRPRRRPVEQFIEFIAQRGPEVGWNGVVLHR